MRNEIGRVGAVSASAEAEEQEQFAARSEWEKSFQLGVDFYLDSGYHRVDPEEFRRRCAMVFDKAWARGGGRFLADRRGNEIWHIAHWAAKSARGVAMSIMDERYKASMAKVAAKTEPKGAATSKTIEKVRERIEAIKATAAAAREKI